MAPEVINAILIGGVIFLCLGGGSIITRWLDNRKQIALKKLEVRALEARARLAEQNAHILMDGAPDWVDRSDPSEVAAWRRARAETNRA